MQVVIRDIICDREQRYSCANCESSCCNFFSVTIDEKTKNTYENDDFIQLILKNANVCFNNKDNQIYYIPKILINGQHQCVFLDENNKCLIHEEKGYNYKPVICQSFPFSMYFDSENNIHIETSFMCDGIMRNHGKLIDDIKTDLIVNYVNLEYFPRVYTVAKKLLQQQDLFLLVDELKMILDDNSLSLNETINKYAKFVYAYKKTYKEKGTVNIASLKEKLDNLIIENSTEKANYHNVLNVYLSSLLLYADYKPDNLLYKNPYKLLYSYIYLFIVLSLKSKKIILPYGSKTLNLSSLNKVKFTHTPHIDSLMRRYLKSNVFRYKYVVKGNDNLTFLDLVIVFYFLIHMYSKILAIASNKEEINNEIIEKTIKTIEYVFYHLNTTVIPSKIINYFVLGFVNKILYKINIVNDLIKS